jgi:hypothetical protein
MNIASLGEARFPSPVAHVVSDQARIRAVIVRDPDAPKRDEVLFELAGRAVRSGWQMSIRWQARQCSSIMRVHQLAKAPTRGWFRSLLRVRPSKLPDPVVIFVRTDLSVSSPRFISAQRRGLGRLSFG